MEYKLNHNATFQRLIAIGLRPEVIIPILKEVDRFLANHGPEWVVSRIKNLKAAYLQNIAGKALTSLDTGFRMHADGTPKGAFRPLFRQLSYKGKIKALNTLMMYSQFTLNKVSSSQWKKFYDSVVNPMPLNGDIRIEITPEMAWSARDCWDKSQYTDLSFWIGSSKRAPLIQRGVSGLVTKVESTVTREEHLAVLQNPYGLDLLYLYPTLYEKSCQVRMKSTDCNLRRNLGSEYPGSPRRCPPMFVGRIGFIQEKGAKLRAIANPFRVHQAALSRLGNALFDFLRTSCPWDCTFDQDKGVKRVSEELARGGTVYTVDLSDATNQFPLSLQMRTLKDLFSTKSTDISGNRTRTSLPKELRESLGLFADISTAKWHLPHQREDLKALNAPFSLSWSKGQPLGLYPSFAAFALTHGLMLKSIEESLGLHQSFIVLGDDVAIFHPEVHRVYQETLKSLGCPVSKLKSLASNGVSEFAGRIITSYGPLPVEKWKPWHPTDPLSVIRQYGWRGRNLVPKKHRSEILTFASIPIPVGLGLNPMGIPLEKRMDGISDLFWNTPEQLEVPPELNKERLVDLAYAFNPYLVRDLSWALTGIEWSYSSPIRRVEDVLLIQHYNVATKHLRDYDVSDYLLQLRFDLQRYVPRISRGDPRIQGKTKTFLHHVKDVVSKMWH